MQFSALRSSINTETSKYSYFGFTKDEDVRWGLTMAKLHASLDTILQGLNAYDMQIELLETTVKDMLNAKFDPARVFSVFKPVQAAKMQYSTAEKSKNIIIGAIAALVDQSQVQGITNLMEFTVRDHNLANTGAVTDDNHREKLIEAYEHITASLVSDQDILQTLDVQQNVIQEEHNLQDCSLHDMSQAFAKWRAEMQQSEPVVVVSVLDNLKEEDQHTVSLNSSNNSTSGSSWTALCREPIARHYAHFFSPRPHCA